MKKKWRKALPLLVMGIMLFSCAGGMAFAAGTVESTGTVSRASNVADVSWYDASQTEFTISTPEQLKELAEVVNGTDTLSGKTVRLGNDIDMTGVTMNVIGQSSSGAFSGTFDGNGHSIKNYTLSSAAARTRVAFFGYTNGAVIKNVSLQGTVTATGSTTYAAGLVGNATNTTISGCSFSGRVTGKSYVGGIVAYAITNTSVSGCTFDGSISSGGYTGGIAAYLNAGNVSNCVNNGSVSFTGTGTTIRTGGIVGYVYGASVVSCCTNTGTVVANKGYAGGIVGSQNNNTGKIEFCVNTGSVSSGSVTNVGGIAGANANIDSCLTTTANVFGGNVSSSYTMKNTFCQAEGTSAQNGVTYYTETQLTDETLMNQLNAGGTPVWKQGTTHPVVNMGTVTGLYLTLNGSAKQYVASQEGNTFTVVIPADADRNALTAENFHASSLVDGAGFSYAEETAGTWKLTGTYGTDTAEYTVQINKASEAWTPEISTDLAGDTDIYYTATLDSVKTLSVAADIYDSGTLSYQWYENTSKSTQDGTPIEGATQASYTPVVKNGDKAAFSTKYYYVVITNTLVLDGKETTASVTSKIQTVKVQYTVTYTDTAVSANNRTEYVDFGRTPTPKALTRAGYDFLGWCSTENYQEGNVWTDASVLNDDITLYACWEAIHYTIQLPETTDYYTVEPADAGVEYVLYDGEYSFRVVPTDTSAFVLVKANGVRINGVDNLYKITDIRENQKVTVEYTKGVEADEDGAYTVANEAELLSVLENAGETPTIKLSEDISITSGTLNAAQEDAFQGVFDGQGHTVTGLNGPLFGWVGENGVVKNLKVSGTLDNEQYKVHYGASVNVGNQGGAALTCPDYIGAIAAINEGLITKCFSDVTMDSSEFTAQGNMQANNGTGLGGIVGLNLEKGVVEFCSFTGSIRNSSANYGGDSYGGIVSLSEGTVRSCYNRGTISGAATGGIAGRLNCLSDVATAVLTGCYNTGRVTSGGFINQGSIAGESGNYWRGQLGCRDSLSNNYYLRGTNSYAYDGASGAAGKAEVQTDDQMKALELVASLNYGYETSIFMKDLDNVNDGYPIFIWQGTPKMSSDTVGISFNGTAQAETVLTAVVDTEQDYTLEWLVCDENGFTVITTLDENEEEVPYRETELLVDNAYVGKSLKVRLTSTVDGSSIVSEAQGPVLPAPIKSISFEGLNTDSIDMILDEINTDRNGTVTLNVLTDPETSNSLLDGEAIVWNSTKEGVVEIESQEETYDSTKDIPAAAVITAAGEGTTQLSVTIGEFTASVEISVHPAYVETTLRIGDAQIPETTVAGAKDLSTVYGEALAGTPEYITPLHLLTSYVSDTLLEEPEDYITIEEGKVTAIGDEQGEWICLVNGRNIGSIDTSYELPEDAEVTFFKKDGVTDKIAFFDKASYAQLYGAGLTVSVSAVSLEGEAEEQPLANAEVIVKKDGSILEELKAVTDEAGNAVLSLPETGVYELTVSHVNAEGADDIVAPYARVTVADKIEVTDIEVSTEEKTMEVGSTYTLAVSVLPENASLPGIVFTSDNEEVASVDEDGLITAKAQGTANITAASADNAEISKTVRITVIRSVTGIQLAEEAATIKVGETYQIEASVVPEDATNGALTYISNKTSVADVDENGMITAKSIGETTIEILSEDGSGVRTVFTITVVTNVVPVESITLNAAETSLEEGNTWQISAMVSPENATEKGVNYTSSNPAVASVSGTGLITAAGAGEAVIKVTAADGSGAAAELKVTVTKREEPGTEKPGDKQDTDDQQNPDNQQNPGDKQNPNGQQPQEPLKIVVGQIYDSGDYYYKVTSTDKLTAEVTGLKNASVTKVVIYNSVNLGGKNYTVTSVAANAFKGNKKITSVVIKKNLLKIGKNAFANCKKLKKVTINSIKLTTIQVKAFSGCSKLKSIVIKSKVLKKVGKNAFKGIHKKAVVKVPSAKLKAYTKLLAKKGQSSTVKIKK